MRLGLRKKTWLGCRCGSVPTYPIFYLTYREFAVQPAVRRPLAVLLVFVLLLCASKPAKADTLKTDATLIIVGIALIASAITVGIVLAIKHKPSLHGCAASGADGLELKNGGDNAS